MNESVVRRADGIAWTSLDDGRVVLVRAAGDRPTPLLVAGTAGHIWGLLDQSRTTAELVRAIGVSSDEVESGVAALLHEQVLVEVSGAIG